MRSPKPLQSQSHWHFCVKLSLSLGLYIEPGHCSWRFKELTLLERERGESSRQQSAVIPKAVQKERGVWRVSYGRTDAKEKRYVCLSVPYQTPKFYLSFPNFHFPFSTFCAMITNPTNLAYLAKYILSPECRSVVMLTGAGVSCSSGSKHMMNCLLKVLN